MERSQILRIVYQVMEELNEDREDNKKLDLSEDTMLLGRGSNLDSLGLVNLVVAVEQSVMDELGTEITLTDEKAMSQFKSPFRTVGSLVNYIHSLLEAGS